MSLESTANHPISNCTTHVEMYSVGARREQRYATLLKQVAFRKEGQLLGAHAVFCPILFPASVELGRHVSARGASLLVRSGPRPGALARRLCGIRVLCFHLDSVARFAASGALLAVAAAARCVRPRFFVFYLAVSGWSRLRCSPRLFFPVRALAPFALLFLSSAIWGMSALAVIRARARGARRRGGQGVALRMKDGVGGECALEATSTKLGLSGPKSAKFRAISNDSGPNSTEQSCRRIVQQLSKSCTGEPKFDPTSANSSFGGSLSDFGPIWSEFHRQRSIRSKFAQILPDVCKNMGRIGQSLRHVLSILFDARQHLADSAAVLLPKLGPNLARLGWSSPKSTQFRPKSVDVGEHRVELAAFGPTRLPGATLRQQLDSVRQRREDRGARRGSPGVTFRVSWRATVRQLFK